MNNKISQLRKFLNNKCSYNNSKIIKRNRKLTFKDIFFFLFSSVTNGTSYALTNSMMKINNIVNVSKQAISVKRNNIDCDLIDTIRKDLIKHIISSKLIAKCKIYAIDGSKLSFSKELIKDKFKLTKNKTYCKALLSCLYDVENKIPIKCAIDNHFNERKSVINKLINEVHKYSIIMFDRGYYSDKIIKILSDKNIYFIIRMKISSLQVKNMIENNLNDAFFYIPNYGIIRLIRYNIDGNDYYLSTNIFDERIDYFKTMYHKRWYVEEYFKTIKHTLNSNNYNSKNINKINQELYAQVILTILARYLEILSLRYFKNKEIKKSKTNKNNGIYQINHKNTINILGNKIIYLILFKKSNNKIINCLLIIKDEKVYIQLNRICKKQRIKPTSKWYYVGIMNNNLFINDLKI